MRGRAHRNVLEGATEECWPGARLLVDSDGGTLGVLSGGCLEEEIGPSRTTIKRWSRPAMTYAMAERALFVRRGLGCVKPIFDSLKN